MRSALALFAVAFALLAGARDAAARSHFDLLLDASGGALALPDRASLGVLDGGVQSDLRGNRPVADVRLGRSSPLGLIGWAARVELVVNRWLLVGLGGLQVDTAFGPAPTIHASADGTPVAVQPWFSTRMRIDLPSVGVRLVHRRLAVEARVRPAVALLFLDAEVGFGKDSVESTAVAASFSLRGEVAVCYRQTPGDRLCGFVDVSAYEFAPLGGGEVGMRWEIGP